MRAAISYGESMQECCAHLGYGKPHPHEISRFLPGQRASKGAEGGVWKCIVRFIYCTLAVRRHFASSLDTELEM